MLALSKGAVKPSSFRLLPLLAVLLVAGATAGCGTGPAQTPLPDSSSLPPRDTSADKARATQAMRDLVQSKNAQAETAKEIGQTR
jgi:hypothetical protein